MRTRLTAGITGLALGAWALAAAAQVPADFAERATEMLDAIYPDDAPGVVVAVSHEGQLVLHHAAGMADLELGVPMQTDHVLRLASVTKQYTAAAILHLVAEGELALEDPLSKFLPDFPVGDVTVHHLLNHTSGIKSYTDIEGYMLGNRVRRDLDTAGLIEVFAGEAPDFGPGEDWSYNNSGYVLLGAIIEAVTDQHWHEYIVEKILHPLEITDTDAYLDLDIVPRRVPGYQGPLESPTNAPFLSMTQPHAAGALSGTAADVDRWQRALHGGRVLPEGLYQRMIRPDPVAEGVVGGQSYGYGLIVGEWMDQPAIHHGGGIFGFNTHALWLPEERLSVVVLANRSGPPPSPQDTSLRLAALVTGETYPADLPALDLPEDELAEWQGTYRIDAETTRTIQLRDGTLVSQRQGGPEFDLTPVEGDRLAFDNSLSWFSTERDDDGNVIAVALHQGWGGEPERAERIGDVDARVEVELSDEDMQRLTGRYQLQPEFIITVRIRDGQLEGQATGQGPFPLKAGAPDMLFNTRAGLEMHFDLPDEGPATGLTLHQGGRESPAPRLEAE